MLDPFTLLTAEMNAVGFWKSPFRSICTANQLVEYIVIDITPTGKRKGKYIHAEAEVARNSDMGANDITFHTVTHLGALLHPGDSVLGYHVLATNFNDDDLLPLRGKALPDVVLVKKVFPNRRKSRGRKKRPWMLKGLDKEVDDWKKPEALKNAHDYEEFLKDLEEDPEFRSHITLYKDPLASTATAATTTAAPASSSSLSGPHQGDNEMADVDDDNDPDFHDVALDELVDDVNGLNIQDNGGNEDGDDDDVMD